MPGEELVGAKQFAFIDAPNRVRTSLIVSIVAKEEVNYDTATVPPASKAWFTSVKMLF